MLNSSWIPIVLASAALLVLLIAAIAHVVVVGRPDEWVLHIRGGRLIRAGVGLTLFRLPGDSVVRLSSTLQRVVFRVDSLTLEHIGVSVEGFALWTIVPDGEGPFRAYRTLGLADLQKPPPNLRSDRHLLTAPQYRALQALFGACVQRLTARRTLQAMLDDQDDLLHALEDCFAEHADELGVHINQVQIVSVRPSDSTMLAQLGATQEASLREKATVVKLETDQRLEQLAITTTANVAEKKAQAELAGATFAIDNEVELSRRRLEAAQQQAEVDHARLAVDQNLKLAELESRQIVDRRHHEIEAEADRAKDVWNREKNQADLERKRDDLVFDLHRIREQAKARHDAIVAIARAESEKSDAVREQQLVELVTTKVTGAFSALPVKDMHWTTWSAEAPMAGIAHTIGELRHLFAPAANQRDPAGQGPNC